MTTINIQEARARLDALARELGVTLSGCGCCESPWLTLPLPEGQEQHVDGVTSLERVTLGGDQDA